MSLVLMSGWQNLVLLLRVRVLVPQAVKTKKAWRCCCGCLADCSCGGMVGDVPMGCAVDGSCTLRYGDDTS